jgi:hypothetical protein
MVMFLFSTASMAQESSNEIIIQKNFFGIKYFQNDRRLTPGEMSKIMEPNAEAYKLVKSGRALGTVSSILSSMGGFLIGYPIGASINGQETNWTMAAVGGGIIVGSIPLQLVSNNKMKKAVATYNKGASSTSFRRTTFSVGATEHGYGLSVQF